MTADFGVNTDSRLPDSVHLESILRPLGGVVRYVLRPGQDEWAGSMRDMGIRLAGQWTGESENPDGFDAYREHRMEWLIVGNETDVPDGLASYPANPDDLPGLIMRAYDAAGTWPIVPYIVSAPMAGPDHRWLERYLPDIGSWIDYVGLNLYAIDLATTDWKLRDARRAYGGYRLAICEWHLDPIQEQLVVMSQADLVIKHCLSDLQRDPTWPPHDGLGVLDIDGRPKPSYHDIAETIRTLQGGGGPVALTTEQFRQKVYTAFNPNIPVGEGFAIYKRWKALLAEGFPIGLPLGPEEDLENGWKGQGFSSGYCLIWKGGDVVELSPAAP